MKKMHQIIKELREDHDLKQKEVAAMIGTNQTYCSTFESGERTLSLDAVIILADYYGVTLDYITGRNYDRFDQKEMTEIFVDNCTYKDLCESVSSFGKPAKRDLLKHIWLLNLNEEKSK